MTALKSNKNKNWRHIWINFNTLENDEEDFDSLQFYWWVFQAHCYGETKHSADSLQQQYAPSTKRSGPEDSPEPASPQTSGRVNILQSIDKELSSFDARRCARPWNSGSRWKCHPQRVWNSSLREWLDSKEKYQRNCHQALVPLHEGQFRIFWNTSQIQKRRPSTIVW